MHGLREVKITRATQHWFISVYFYLIINLWAYIRYDSKVAQWFSFSNRKICRVMAIFHMRECLTLIWVMPHTISYHSRKKIKIYLFMTNSTSIQQQRNGNISPFGWHRCLFIPVTNAIQNAYLNVIPNRELKWLNTTRTHISWTNIDSPEEPKQQTQHMTAWHATCCIIPHDSCFLRSTWIGIVWNMGAFLESHHVS